MQNKKGFTLIEVMTVVFIIGILAALSLPFLMGYARDARNDRAKSILHIVAQGYKNFASDFSRAAAAVPLDEALGNKITIQDCDLSKLTASTVTGLTYRDLIYCSYIPNMDYADTSYNFYLGPSDSCCEEAAADNALACMQGADTGDYGSNYCAYIAESGGLQEVYGS